MSNWSNDSVNYFDALDKAFIHHGEKLFSNQDDVQRQAILLKDLLTINGNFDDSVFDFIIWVVSDSNRQMELSKICKIKFISKSDQKLLKLFMEADSRCCLNAKNLPWMKKSLASWLKVCKAEKPKYLAAAEAMVKNTEEYKEDQPVQPKIAPPVESKPEQKISSTPSIDSASDYGGSVNEDDMILGSPRERALSRNNSFHKLKNESPGHRRSFSDFSQINQQMYPGEMMMDHPPMIPRPMSMRSMSPMNQQSDYAPSVCYDQFDDIVASKDHQIMQLKSELECKYNEINILQSRKPNPSSEQMKLEKELKDMMKYYEGAIASKDEEYSKLEKELEAKDLKCDVSIRQIQKELDEAKVSFEEQSKKQIEEFADALSKLEKELAKAHEKNNLLFKNCEMKLDHFRSEIAEKNQLLSFYSNDQAKLSYIKDLENSVALIKAAQTRMDRELEETKMSRDMIVETTTIEINNLKEQILMHQQHIRELSELDGDSKPIVTFDNKSLSSSGSIPTSNSESQTQYIQQLELTKETMELELNHLRSEMRSLHEAAASTSLVVDHSATVASLEKRLTAADQLLSAKDSELKELKGKVSSISSLEMKIAMADQLLSKKETEMQELKSKYNDAISSQSQTKTPDVEEIIIINSEVPKELTIAECRDMIVDLKKKIVDLQTEKRKAEKELLSSRAAYDKLKAATDVIVSYEEDRSTYINNLEAKIQAAYEENTKLESQCTDLKTSLANHLSSPIPPQPVDREESKLCEDKENNNTSNIINLNLMSKLESPQKPTIKSSRLNVSKKLDKRAAEVLRAKNVFQEKLNFTQNIINTVNF